MPIAIPAPRSSVPASSPALPANERVMTPRKIATTAASNVFPAPSASLMRRTNGDRIANMMSGIVVNSPKTPLLNGNSVFMDETSGPTAVIGARRLTATKINPMNSRRLNDWLCVFCSDKSDISFHFMYHFCYSSSSGIKCVLHKPW
ncbi:hypothetical protein SDC9_172127 [bioreactor metagenome]|uniref:Uncharacterized protein n=1 Tax=bioreactor metagenome TaxID=1076179 RepID=A0A645GDH1_9ZZZZ